MSVMAAYLARITVRDVLDDEESAGMGDALSALEAHEQDAGTVTFVVLGEAPDLSVASAAAHQHAAEVLDGYVFEIDVSEMP